MSCHARLMALTDRHVVADDAEVYGFTVRAVGVHEPQIFAGRKPHAKPPVSPLAFPPAQAMIVAFPRRASAIAGFVASADARISDETSGPTIGGVAKT